MCLPNISALPLVTGPMSLKNVPLSRQVVLEGLQITAANLLSPLYCHHLPGHTVGPGLGTCSSVDNQAPL